MQPTNDSVETGIGSERMAEGLGGFSRRVSRGARGRLGPAISGARLSVHYDKIACDCLVSNNFPVCAVRKS